MLRYSLFLGTFLARETLAWRDTTECVTDIASVGFVEEEQTLSSTDVNVLPNLSKYHSPVSMKACFEGQVINFLQTTYGVIDFKGGYTEEIRGALHGDPNLSADCVEYNLMDIDISAVELFYDTGSGMVRMFFNSKESSPIEVSSDLIYEKAG